jgi:hypothetical protein
MTEAETLAFEARWDDWQRRGARQDAASQRRLQFALPILAFVIAGATWFLR